MYLGRRRLTLSLLYVYIAVNVGALLRYCYQLVDAKRNLLFIAQGFGWATPSSLGDLDHRIGQVKDSMTVSVFAVGSPPFYRTQVYLGSDLWVQVSLSTYIQARPF